MGQRKRRADGLLERKRTIDGKVVHFYGHTLAEVEQKIDDYKAALAETKAQGEKFSVVYDDWMKLRRTQIKPSTLYCSAGGMGRLPNERNNADAHCRLVSALGGSGLCKGYRAQPSGYPCQRVPALDCLLWRRL